MDRVAACIHLDHVVSERRRGRQRKVRRGRAHTGDRHRLLQHRLALRVLNLYLGSSFLQNLVAAQGGPAEDGL